MCGSYQRVPHGRVCPQEFVGRLSQTYSAPNEVLSPPQYVSNGHTALRVVLAAH
jgi:hypothetical protein